MSANDPIAVLRIMRHVARMTVVRLLSEKDFEACFATPMRNVTKDPDPRADIWPYVDDLDLDALALPSINDVHHVYRDAHDRFDQVLIGTGRFNVLLAVVVDRHLRAVHGHHLLDLNERFDVHGQHLREVR